MRMTYCTGALVLALGLVLAGVAVGGEQSAEAAQVEMKTGQGKEMVLTLQTLPNSREYQYCELVLDYGDVGNDIYSTSPVSTCFPTLT